ncbi:MAG: hypothetical protein ABEH83_04275 [Halobacterium sp.]
MKRRTYVASVVGLAATGGCVSAVSSVMAGGDSEESPAAPADCPSFDADAETVCVGEDAAVTFSRSDAAVADGEQFSVTLSNEDADAVGLNPYAWTVYRRDSDGWTQVAPDAFVEPWRSLDEGESLSWHVQVGGEDVPDSEQGVHVGPLDLADGEHAFTLLAEVDGDRTEFVAPFAVE